MVVEGNVATITAGGTYRLSGTLSNGQIAVDSDDDEPVTLVLDGVSIHNETSAAINIINAEQTVVVLADGSDNVLSDGSSYVFADAETDEPNATLFSDDDLVISGNGSLTVSAAYNDAIASKNTLTITSGTINVVSADDGIRGKDELIIEGGNLTLSVAGDGLKADEDDDASMGTITITGGNISIDAGGDAIQAETTLAIAGGSFALTTGGGSSSVIGAEDSAKALKSGVATIIDGGTFSINSADDAVHSNGSIVINGGSFAIATGDDGVHADETLTINAGVFDISQSYEGIESALITINGGDFNIVASDDGVNVAGGVDGSGAAAGPGRGGQGGPGSQETFDYTGDYYLYINGGTFVIDSGGDGVDVNGAFEMTDGVVVVNGPITTREGAVDYDAYYTISGGTLLAVGSVGMAQAPSTNSTQSSLALYFDSVISAETLIHLQTESGETLVTFSPSKEYQSVVYSSPELVEGETVEVYVGGTASLSEDGLSFDDGYTPGELATSVTISGSVTQVGDGGNSGGRVR